MKHKPSIHCQQVFNNNLFFWVANFDSLIKKLILFYLCLLSVPAVYASDYCGQPIPQDIAQHGYQQNMVENAFADPGANSSALHPSVTLQGQAIYIPPGASIPAILDRPVGSGFSRRGEIVYAHINQGGFGIPGGTVAEITVLMVQPARWGFARPGKLQLAANRLILPTGQSIWLKALVTNQAGQQKMQGQTLGSRLGYSAGKVAIGAGGGAVGGLVVSTVADGSLGIGTAVGTAVGAVVGGIWAAASKGKDVTLPSGTKFYLQITEGSQAFL